MIDLTDKLRDKKRLRQVHGVTGWVLYEESLLGGAADEIDRLRARIAELEAAQKWRPASEPPETNKRVAVLFEDGDWDSGYHDIHGWFDIPYEKLDPKIIAWLDIDPPKMTREE